LLRRDSTVEGLKSTATVLGLFETWSCSVEERQLVPGDALALYSDGITESANDKCEEFGPRLIEGLQRRRELPAEALLASVVDEVRQFSSGDQQDDITLIIAKCR
jgi:serine phosphatase RsbU (regulator of sigma subunit)